LYFDCVILHFAVVRCVKTVALTDFDCCSRPVCDDAEESDDVVEIRLRQTKPTSTNLSVIMDDMSSTRVQRRNWILNSKPSATEVLQRWPRYADVPQTVSHG